MDGYEPTNRPNFWGSIANALKMRELLFRIMSSQSQTWLLVARSLHLFTEQKKMYSFNRTKIIHSLAVILMIVLLMIVGCSTSSTQDRMRDFILSFQEGITYADKQQYNRAINSFTLAIEANPSDFNSYYNRGLVYAILGKFSEAIIDYNRALAIDSKYAEAYGERGLLRLANEENSLAIADFSFAISLAPQNGEFYFYRAFAFSDNKQLEAAQKDLDIALSLSCPDVPGENLCLAATEFKSKVDQEFLILRQSK